MSRSKSFVFAFSVLVSVLLFALGFTSPDLALADVETGEVLQANPESLNFGNVTVGTTSPAKTVSATNTSKSLVKFQKIVTPAPFLLASNTCVGSLASHQACQIDVACKPTAAGTVNRTLKFYFDRSRTEEVVLACTGVVATPTPTTTSNATPTATSTSNPTPSATATPTITATPKPEFSGQVLNGSSPVSGASIKILEAGSTGYGTGAIQIGTATSAADGTFSSGILPCASTAEIYMTAQGGNAGGGTNSSLMMMALAGECETIGFGGKNFIVNDVTTAASAYALAQFLSTSNSGTVGAPSTNATGLADASGTEGLLVDPTTGTALSTTGGGSGAAPQKNLDSIANALGACDQTNGASSAACTELFDCALPGAVFSAGACSGGTGSVADTLTAALSIALHPASVSVAGIEDVASKVSLYSPALASAPNDWSMPLTFALPTTNSSSFYGVAIDGSGRIWVTDSGRNTVNNFAPMGSNFDAPQSVAIDSANHVWVANEMGNTITALNHDGTLLGNFAPAGSNFSEPSGVAVDGSGRVWVSNRLGNTVTALNNDGTLLGNFAPSGSNYAGPNGVAIDSSGNVWTPNLSGNTVTALNNAGALLGNFAPSGSNFNMPFDVKVDGSGHIWLTNNGGNTVTALNNDGTLFGNFAPAGSNFSGPQGITIDSSGRVWVVNENGPSVTALNNTGTLFGNFNPPGANFGLPLRLAIDSSGNVWVTNSSSTVDALTELVGAAAPVKTPFIGPPQLP